MRKLAKIIRRSWLSLIFGYCPDPNNRNRYYWVYCGPTGTYGPTGKPCDRYCYLCELED